MKKPRTLLCDNGEKQHASGRMAVQDVRGPVIDRRWGSQGLEQYCQRRNEARTEVPVRLFLGALWI